VSKGGGVGKKTAELVIERDGQCFAKITHQHWARLGEQIHHRKPRRMGGSTATGINEAANLIWLCASCHAWIESHREAGYLHGWLVNATDEPKNVPVLRFGQVAVLLDNQGGYTEFVATPG
jgi:hypothetical protein